MPCFARENWQFYGKETGTLEPGIKSLISAVLEELNVVMLSNFFPTCVSTSETIMCGIKGEKNVCVNIMN